VNFILIFLFITNYDKRSRQIKEKVRMRTRLSRPTTDFAVHHGQPSFIIVQRGLQLTEVKQLPCFCSPFRCEIDVLPDNLKCQFFPIKYKTKTNSATNIIYIWILLVSSISKGFVNRKYVFVDKRIS
jgi:hypothetical protein